MINFYSILDKIIQFDTTSHKSNFEVISYIEHLFEKKNNYKIYKVLNSEKNKSSILINDQQINFSNKLQKFIEKIFSDFFGFMLFAKLTK